MWKAIEKGFGIFLPQHPNIPREQCQCSLLERYWCREDPLSESFPSLYALTVNKDAWEADFWEYFELEGGWVPCFSKAFGNWELEDVQD